MKEIGGFKPGFFLNKSESLNQVSFETNWRVYTRFLMKQIGNRSEGLNQVSFETNRRV